MNIFSPGTINKIELIVAAVAIVAVVLVKLLHVQAMAPIMVISLSSLALLYARGLPMLLGGEKEQQNFGLNTATGVLLSIACVGILFRLQYWPGAKNMVMVAALGLPILIAVVFYLKGRSEISHQSYFNKLLIRQAVLAAFAVSLFFVSNKALLTLQYPNDPEAVRIKSNHFDHPENEAYTKEYMEYMEMKRKR